MKITILTQYFPPEVGAPQNRLFELAVRLKARGNEVTVLTAMPNYPHMRIHDDYRGKRFVREEMEGITVLRTGIYMPKNKGILQRLLNYFSFVLSSLFVGIFRLRRSDWLICESPPLFLGISAYILSRLKFSRLVFNVSDLWPESAEKLGLVTNGFFLRLATKLEEFMYRKSALITGQTQGIVENIQTRFPGKEVYWLPNGADTKFYTPRTGGNSWRIANGYAADDLLILYAGIIGHAQGLEVILNAAKILNGEKRVKFIMLGEGPEKAKLKALKDSLGLPNVRFIDAIPKSAMPELIDAVDATVIPLKKIDLFKGAIPSKIFESLAMKKPVLLGVEGEAKKLFIDEGNAGLFFEPENAASLAGGVQRLLTEPKLLADLGENGRKYVEEKFERDKIAENFNERLNTLPTASIFRETTSAINQLLILCGLFFMPFGLFLGFITVLLLANWLFGGNWKEKISRLRNNRVALAPWILYYALVVTGMLWTENKDEGWISVQVKAALLILPVCFASTRLTTHQTQRAIKVFLAGLVAAGLFMLGRSTYIYFTRDANTFFYQQFSEKLVHPAYLAMYYCTGIMLLFHGILLQAFPKRQKAFAIALSVFFATIIFLLSSKMGILAMIVLFGGYIVYAIIRFRRYVVGIASLAALVIGFFIAINIFPSVAGRFETMKRMLTMNVTDPSSVESNQVRTLVWRADYALAERHAWTGVGTGDVRDSLNAEYLRRGMTGAYNEELNAHSQLFQSAVALGIPGLLAIILLIFGPAVWAIRKRFGFAAVFALLFFVNIVPESMFEVQAGTLFFGFFYSLILFAFDRNCLSPLKAPPLRL
jgi:glycosyltransferase involved in cell wall biosynthesis